MKTLVCLIVLLILSVDSMEQTVSFPTSGAEWFTATVTSCGTGGSTLTERWVDFLEGDTLVGDVVYYKVFRQSKCWHCTAGMYSPELWHFYDYDPYLLGGIREDSGKVYFRSFMVPNEQAIVYVPRDTNILLYDFNLVEGDTFVVQSLNIPQKRFVVYSVRIQDGRKFIRLIRSNGIGYQRIMIEGMGENDGLFGMYYNPVSSPVPVGACFVLNGVLPPGVTNCDACGLVGNYEPDNYLPIIIFPNPAKDEIFIQTDSGDNPFLLRIYSSSGELIYYNKEFRGNTYLQTQVLGLSGLLYFILTDRLGRSYNSGVLVL